MTWKSVFITYRYSSVYISPFCRPYNSPNFTSVRRIGTDKTLQNVNIVFICYFVKCFPHCSIKINFSIISSTSISPATESWQPSNLKIIVCSTGLFCKISFDSFDSLAWSVDNRAKTASATSNSLSFTTNDKHASVQTHTPQFNQRNGMKH